MAGENHRGAELSAVEDFDDLDPGDDYDGLDDVDNIEELAPPGPPMSDDIEDIDGGSGEYDENGGAIILEGPKVHIGGDDEYADEEYAPAPAPAPERSEAEEEARARARARAERNRLKKIAAKEAAGGAPREPRQRQERRAPERQPMRRELRPGSEREEKRPKRDYANQDDWDHPNRRRSEPMTVKKFAIIAGISLGSLVVLLVVGVFLYDFYDRHFSNAEEEKAETIYDEQRKRKLKLPAHVKQAMNDQFGDEVEEEEDRARPRPPSQQNEEMVENLSDDGIRTIFNRIDTMKRELRELNRRQNRIETALDDLEEVLQSATEQKRPKARSKKKRKSRR